MTSKLEQWQNIPDAAAWLNETLNHPMGRFFLEVLEERHELRLNLTASPGALTAYGPALSGSVFGYERCLETIRRLRTGAEVETKPAIETYGVDKPEDATE